MTATADPFSDLDGELNFLELNSLYVDTTSPNVSGNLSMRLERWAEYYAQPDHRGEIYDIMEGIVLPFLKEQLKNESLENIRIAYHGGQPNYLVRGGDIRIVADTYVMEMYGGAGA